MKTARPRGKLRLSLASLLTCAALLTASVPAQVVNPAYQPSGAGGQPRTAQEWMSERPVSLRDYKCVGDGIADDTTCIQNAFNELFRRQGGALYVPKGTYRFTADIAPRISTGNRFFRIVGDGMEVSKFVTSNQRSLRLYSDTPPARTDAFVNVWMEGFSVSNASAGTSSSACIDVYSVQRAVITNVMATGCNYGLRVRSSWNLTIAGRSQFTHNNVGIKVPRDAPGAGRNEGFNAVDIHGISVGNNAKAGISIAHANVVSIRDVLAESNPVAVYLLEGVNHATIESLYYETSGPYTRTNRAGSNQGYTVYTGTDEDNTAANATLPIIDLTVRSVMPHAGDGAMYFDNIDGLRLDNQIGRSYVTFGANVRNVISTDSTGHNDLTTPIVPNRGRSIARNVNRQIVGNLIPNGNFAMPGLPYMALSGTGGMPAVARSSATLDGAPANTLAITCPSGATQCRVRFDAPVPAGAQFAAANVGMTATAHVKAAAANVSSVNIALGDQRAPITGGTQSRNLTTWSVISANQTVNLNVSPVTLVTVTLTMNTTGAGAARLDVEEVALFPNGQARLTGLSASDQETGLSGTGTASNASGAWWYADIDTELGFERYFDAVVTPIYDGSQTVITCQPQKTGGSTLRVWCNKNGAQFAYRILPKVVRLP
jgi:hypothetical protein